MTTPDPLSQLEAAAREATPGEWWLHVEPAREHTPTLTGAGHYRRDYHAVVSGPIAPEPEDTNVITDDAGYYSKAAEPNDLAFIALANPATILALIGRLRKAEAVVFQVRIYASFDPAEGSSARHIAHRKTVEALAEYDKGSK